MRFRIHVHLIGPLAAWLLFAAAAAHAEAPESRPAARGAAPNAVIVNEFLYGDAGTTVYPVLGSGIVGDWVELLVVSGPADLRGWQLCDHNAPASATEGTLTLPAIDGLAAVPTGTLLVLVTEAGNAALAEDLDPAGGSMALKLAADGGSLAVAGFSLANSDDNIVILDGAFADYPPAGAATTVAVDFTAEGSAALAANWGLTFANPFSGIGGGDGCYFTNDAAQGWSNDDGNVGWVKDIQASVCTPGAANPGQVLPGANLPPALTNPSALPARPTSSDPLDFAVEATDAGGVAAVRLYHAATAGGPFAQVAMSPSTGATYVASLPARADGTAVFYYFEAEDSVGAVATLGTPAAPRRLYVSDRRPAAGEVVINEFSAKAGFAGAPDVDWIELHNTAAVARDLSFMGLADNQPTSGGRPFVIPQGTTIPAGGFVLLLENAAAFAAHAPWDTSAGATARLGDFTFGFGSSGDTVSIYDDAGALYDTVVYDAAAPWDVEATTDASAELIDPLLDNADRANWSTTATGNTAGSPGRANFALLPAATANGVFVR